MAPSISTLYPPTHTRPAALALKLNPDVLQHLRSLHQAHTTPKLVVKDGKFSVKISDTLIFPCSASPETLRLDIYSPAATQTQNYHFTGTVTSRLNVLSDPKHIKEHARVPAAETPVLPPPSADLHPGHKTGESPQKEPSSAASKAYLISSGDSALEKANKFISFVALGPMTRPEIEEKLRLAKHMKASEIDHLFSAHTQPFLRKDTFTEGDVYPLLASGTAADITASKTYVILKDKAYKELRPWQWHAYTEYERKLILDNCNHALSRLGYSETHPLRLRIVERSSPVRPVKKSAGLGGGLLMSNSKKASSSQQEVPTLGPGSPVPANLKSRASTESPKLSSEARRKFAEKGRKVVGSPLRQEPPQSHGAGLASSSSSDDEKATKKPGSSGAKRHSNASNSSTNSNSNSYTSPSSVNEEAHSESDHDAKTAGNRAATSLPNRPSSSFTNHEKKSQYYAQLAEKFRSRYKEYEHLHKQLSKDSRKNTHAEKKKSLMKLFELHNTLSEWKRRLWDYHDENNMAEGVMNLAKHRKSNSLSKISASAPSTSKVASTERFSHIMGNRESQRKSVLAERPAPARAKFALDY